MLYQCRHCRKKPACRPRRLCWHCYYANTESGGKVRDLYAPDPGYSPSDVCQSAAHQLPEPTAARPGSPEKIAVLEYRAANRFLLWHPFDWPRGQELL